MAPAIDVVIPTYRRWDLTGRCLEHLARQTAPHTVVVVEDSGDGVPADFRASWPGVRFLDLSENRGFTHACNTGAAGGSGEILVVLNNDAFCRPDFLERLAEPFEQDPRVGTVTPLALEEDEATVDDFGLTIDPTLACFPVARGLTADEVLAAPPPIVGSAGGADGYRRAAFEEVGGYDERLTMYAADVDLAVRIATAGWRPTTAATARVVHLRSATAGRRSPRARESVGFARGYLVRRYGLLRSRLAPRVLATEALVVLGELVLSRDLVAVRSRFRGWRAARGLPRRPMPPAELIDRSIGFVRSLRLRWAYR